MAAPTLTSQTGSTWTDLSGAGETTGTLTWNAGDRVLAMALTEDAAITLATPTATGLTFSALGSPLAVSSSCWAHAWTATPGASGSSAVTAAIALGGTAMRGVHVLAFGGCTGFVRTDGATQDTTKTVTVSRTQANSFVVVGLGDWSAGATTGLGWTPAGQTQLQAANSVDATLYLAYWGDQGSVGSTAYGATGVTGTKYTRFAVEVLGTITASTPVGQSLVLSQAVNRSYTY